MRTTRIAAAQTPNFREDMEAALDWAIDVTKQAQAAGAALLVFPECFLQGYLTEEDAARRAAVDLESAEFQAVLERFPANGPVMVMGLIEVDGGQLHNTAVVVEGGVVRGCYRKAHLLGGERCFAPGTEHPVFEAGGLRFGINICNDLNFPEAARKVVETGASLLVCPANNMLERETAEKFREIHNRVRGERCRETGLWLVSADVAGEREGRVSLGPTAVINPAGEVVAQLPLGKSGLLVFDIPGGA